MPAFPTFARRTLSDFDGLPALFRDLRLDAESAVLPVLLAALSATSTGLHLCDEEDRLRYVNEAMRSSFFPNLPPGPPVLAEPIPFSDALRGAILSEGSMKLESMPLDHFVAMIAAKRKALQGERSFTVDLKDGGWLVVTDTKLANGWILAVAMDVSALKREEFRLREAHGTALRASCTDNLTDIANRRGGMAMAERALAGARETGEPLCLAILDVDHFKQINDCYGHAIGDRILIAFAQLLDREGGASRIGGEEFLLVMPGLAAGEAKAGLDAMMRRLAPVSRADEAGELPYTFSAGIAAARPGDSLEVLLRRADTALYRAKTNGRARVEIDGA